MADATNQMGLGLELLKFKMYKVLCWMVKLYSHLHGCKHRLWSHIWNVRLGRHKSMERRTANLKTVL